MSKKREQRITPYRVASLGSKKTRARLAIFFLFRLLVNMVDLLAMSLLVIFLSWSSRTNGQSPGTLSFFDLSFLHAIDLNYLPILAVAFFVFRSIFAILSSLAFAREVAILESSVASRITSLFLETRSSAKGEEEFDKVQMNVVLSCRRLFTEYLNSYLVVASETLLLVMLSILTLFYSPAAFFALTSIFGLLGTILWLLLSKVAARISVKYSRQDAATYRALQNLYFGREDIQNFSSWERWSSVFYQARLRHAWLNSVLRVIGTIPRHVIELVMISALAGYVFLNSQGALPVNLIGFEAAIALVVRFAGSVIPLQAALTNLEAQKAGGYLAYSTILEGRKKSADESVDSWSQSGNGKYVFDLIGDTSESNVSNDNWRSGYRFETGKCYALVGPSGSGKTTLMRLIANAGEKEVNHITVETLEGVKGFRGNGVFLSSTPYFFLGSVAENVAMRPLSLEESLDSSLQSGIRSALAEAGILDEIEAEGREIWDEMGTGGSLSTGQLQRVAIARAFYSKARILMLDEPTSALDRKAESVVLEGIKRYAKNERAIVIFSAHRQSAIHFADVVLDLT